MYSKFIKII